MGRLQKYPKIHVSTGEESSGSGPDSTQGLRPQHRWERNPERPPRNSHGDWPFLRPPERVPEVHVGKNSRRSRRISRGGTLHRKGQRNSRVMPPFQESPKCVSPVQRNLFSLHCLDVHAEDRLPPRFHVDSTLGKPRGKASRENHRSLDPGSRMGDTAAIALEESTSACPHSSRGLTPLGSLQMYPKIHVSTGEESSGSGPDSTQGLRPRHRRERNPERPPRNSHGDWPFLRGPERVPEVPVGKNSRRSRRISRGGTLHRKGQRNSRVVPPFLESPRCVSPFQRNLFSLHCLDVHAEDRLPPRFHVDSTLGKPRGKASRENHRSLDPGSRMGDTAAIALEESTSACPHSSRGLTPLGSLQMYPKIHVSTGEESSSSGPDSTQGLRPRHRRERNPERPPRNSHGDWPFLRGPERVPEVPVGKNSRRSRRISRGGTLHRKGQRNSRVMPPFQESPKCVSPVQRNLFSLHCLDVHAEDRLPPRFHVDSTLGKPRGKASRENHRSLDPGSRMGDTAAIALEESTSACPHSSRGLTPLGSLQMYPKIHVSTGEESSGSGPDSTQGLRPRHRRERNPERPPRNSHGDWPFLRGPERVPEVPVGKNSRRSRRISRGGTLHRKGQRNSRVVPPFQESPRCVSPFQRNLFSLHCLDVHAEDRLPPRFHVDSTLGKPRGKASRENHRSLDPGSRMGDTAAIALEESTSACPHSSRRLTPLGSLQMYPKIHVSTGEESSSSGPDSTQGLRPRHRWERNPERPSRNSHGDWPFLRGPERVPEVPVVSRQHLPQLEKIQEVLPSRRNEAHFR
ncbi:hypothetical protein MJG53_000051 [Ovis ammon polii x Ovis aries]|nr:hypothetical protein MJG53_000051 [Ovis ammon polii x Ovis aries]